MSVSDWLEKETFRVEHNPNCPSAYLVRLCLRGAIYGDDRDAVGCGKTLREAAGRARIQRDAIRAIERAKLAGVGIPGVCLESRDE